MNQHPISPIGVGDTKVGPTPLMLQCPRGNRVSERLVLWGGRPTAFRTDSFRVIPRWSLAPGSPPVSTIAAYVVLCPAPRRVRNADHGACTSVTDRSARDESPLGDMPV